MFSDSYVGVILSGIFEKSNSIAEVEPIGSDG